MDLRICNQSQLEPVIDCHHVSVFFSLFLVLMKLNLATMVSNKCKTTKTKIKCRNDDLRERHTTFIIIPSYIQNYASRIFM